MAFWWCLTHGAVEGSATDDSGCANIDRLGPYDLRSRRPRRSSAPARARRENERPRRGRGRLGQRASRPAARKWSNERRRRLPPDDAHALSRDARGRCGSRPRAARRPAARSRRARGPRRRSGRSRAGARRRPARPGRAAARARSAGSRRRCARRWPRARWPRSATRPSLTSHIAVAPSAGELGPEGVRRARLQVGLHQHVDRAPRRARSRCCSSASPAADQPSRPASTTRSPGCAPERSTGGRPPRSPSAVTLTTTWSLETVSPPTTTAPTTAGLVAQPVGELRRPTPPARRAERRARRAARWPSRPSPRRRRGWRRRPCGPTS